jgi:acetylornithine deacetylase
VIFGPGSIDQAHQPDEYLATERIDPAVDVLARVIEDVCMR